MMRLPQLVTWLEMALIWAFLSFGLVTDRTREDRERQGAIRWQLGLACRSIVALVASIWFSGSWVLGAAAALAVAVPAQIRYRSARPLVLNELVPPAAFLSFDFIYINRFAVTLQHQLQWDIQADHLAALLTVATTLCLALRWGAFLVKSVLGLATPMGFATKLQEIKRGALIGILERLLLVVMIALGSYAALGFLIAAKCLVRSHQFDGTEGRDFTEYFLIGTLVSTFIAVCAGLTIRYALHALWPELLVLDTRSD